MNPNHQDRQGMNSGSTGENHKEMCVILPEDFVPEEAQHCKRCELFRQGTRMIWGEGNPYAPIMMILDNPGAREDRAGRMFVCSTRQTLQHGIRKAGLPLDEVYVTYILKRRPLRAYNKPLTRANCLHHLHDQIQTQCPQLMVGFGNAVCESLFPGREDASVKQMRGNWHEYMNVPIRFTYHPLAVRRRPNLMKAFVAELQAVRERWYGDYRSY